MIAKTILWVLCWLFVVYNAATWFIKMFKVNIFNLKAWNVSMQNDIDDACKEFKNKAQTKVFAIIGLLVVVAEGNVCRIAIEGIKLYNGLSQGFIQSMSVFLILGVVGEGIQMLRNTLLVNKKIQQKQSNTALNIFNVQIVITAISTSLAAILSIISIALQLSS